MILAAVPDAAEKGLIDAPADVIERMQAQAGTFGAAELTRAADLVNAGLTEMRGATSPASSSNSSARACCCPPRTATSGRSWPAWTASSAE